MPKSKDELERQLLAAHASNDVVALVQLYQEAGLTSERDGNIDAACFYFTHAYVFALENGDEAAAPLLRKLVKYGRDVAG